MFQKNVKKFDNKPSQNSISIDGLEDDSDPVNLFNEKYLLFNEYLYLFNEKYLLFNEYLYLFNEKYCFGNPNSKL